MRSRLVLAVLSVVVGLGACSDDGGDDDDADGGSGGGSGSAELTSAEQEFADAWSSTLQDAEDGFGVAEGDADCMGAAIMAELGTEPFEDAAVTVADIGADDTGANSPGELLGAGVITDAQAGAILDAWDADCTDLADMLSAAADSEFGTDEEGAACFAAGLREGDLARNLLLPAFTSDDDDPPEEVLGQMVALLESCGDEDGGLLVDSIVSDLTADGDMTEGDARCIAQGLIDDVGIDRLSELTAGGSFENADADARAEFTRALITAAGACDVPL